MSNAPTPSSSYHYYSVTVNNKKVVGLCEGYPAPDEWNPDQIELTHDEYFMLKQCGGDIAKGRALLNRIQKKINALGDE